MAPNEALINYIIHQWSAAEFPHLLGRPLAKMWTPPPHPTSDTSPRCTFHIDVSIYHQYFRIRFQPFALVLLFCIHRGTQLLIVLQIHHTTPSVFCSPFHIHELKCYGIWDKFPTTLWFYLLNFSVVLANVLFAADQKTNFFARFYGQMNYTSTF